MGRTLADTAADLAAIVGPANVLVDAVDTAPYLVDHRRRMAGQAAAVVRPATTAEVAEVVRWCHRHRVPVVPIGGNTGLCGGATADDPAAVVLSVERMRSIRRLDTAARVVVAEAGCTVAQVQEAAAAADLAFPLRFGADGSARIGGALATNAGGTNVVRYGMARDRVLGLEVVLADGRVLDGLRGLRKDNTGYALHHLFVGGEGTLGVITAAALSLVGPIRERVVAMAAVPDPHAALALLSGLRDATDDRVSSFELIDRASIELVAEHRPGVSCPFDPVPVWLVLIELGSSAPGSRLGAALEAVLADAVAHGRVLDATIAASHAGAETLWRLREAVPEADLAAGGSAKHDVSVPVASVPEFVEAVRPAVAEAAPGSRLVVFGHLGDGNLHVNVLGLASSAEAAATTAVYGTVAAFGGSISAEHGVGRFKRDALARYGDPVALSAMRAVKDALDPLGLMNPGVLLPDVVAGPDQPST